MNQELVEHYYNRLKNNELFFVTFPTIKMFVVWFELIDNKILVEIEKDTIPNNIYLGEIDYLKNTSTVNIEDNEVKEYLNPLIERLLTYG